VANFALSAFFKTLSKVIGTEVVDDLVLFFQAFEGMEEGFRQRARKVTELLANRETAFLLVTSPGRDAVDEARFFARRLRESRLAVDALVVNRVHPEFGQVTAATARARAVALRTGGAEAVRLADLYDTLADFTGLVEREREVLAGLAAEIGDVPTARVPLLPIEVCDVPSLAVVGTHLFPAR
jgi:anion-transporting  ArsA/GET3 family ATPase